MKTDTDMEAEMFRDCPEHGASISKAEVRLSWRHGQCCLCLGDLGRVTAPSMCIFCSWREKSSLGGFKWKKVEIGLGSVPDP